ncbi:ECF transporter S component [Clostridium ihumii]|uniref:ECF transporter S component n=1 Tax=Clostridium ihumii TaxID=1470356 RepID=UPI003D3303E8
MRRRIKLGFILIALYLAIIFVMTYNNLKMDKAIEISSIFIIITFIILFENKEMSARTMAAVATMAALGGVLRVPCAVIPGFQPVTFITAVSGYTLGPINGFMVGAICAFISNFFLGHGPWTMWQILGWGLCGMFFGIFKVFIQKSFKRFIVLCGLWGYIYGFILNQWYVLEFIHPINLKAMFIGSIGSFGHDTLHAIGNVLFAYLFGKTFIEALERYNRKNEFLRIKV